MKRGIWIVMLFALGCETLLDDGGNNADDAGLLDSGGTAVIVTSDYQTGSYTVISPADLSTQPSIGVIHQDAICRFDPLQGLVFIVSRLGADSISVLDPAQGWGITAEYSVGAGTNPQDMAVVSKDKAYIARLNAPDLLVVHPTLGTEIGSVDLSAYADADGLAEPSWLYPAQGKIIVLLQRLDQYRPTEKSTLVEIDTATDQVVHAVDLARTNPFGRPRYSLALDRLVIVESGKFGTTSEASLEGGIELYNMADGTLSGLIVTEETLGGDVVEAVIASPTKGYAIVGMPEGDGSSTRVVIFDPSSGTATGVLLDADEWVFASLDLSPDGTRLWISDRTMFSPGLRIFDVAIDQEVTPEPVNVGLPPVCLCFVE